MPGAADGGGKLMAWKGADEHLARLRKLSGSEVVRVAGAVVVEGADTIRAEAFRSISRGSVSGKGHVASSPGEPPNRDTGELQANLEAVQTGPLTAEVRSKAPYAAALERGTSKMAARPYMRPARDKKRDQIEKRFAAQMSKLVKRSG